jgi:hypothetical protein
MKRLLTVLVLIFCFSAAHAGVNIRMQKISETLLAGTITLDVSLKIQSSSSYRIFKLEGQFYVGNGLRDICSGSIITDPDLFPDADYVKNSAYSLSSGYGSFSFVLDTLHDRTGIRPSTTVWTEILQYRFTYPKTEGEFTTFQWSGNYLYPLWAVDSYFIIDPDTLFYNSAGVQSMPADLVDMALPVQMGDVIAKYSYDKGVLLNWKTHSELNSAGFHILRSKNSEGPYERITPAMIAGQGTCSSEHEYSFADPNVKWDEMYYYQIHEISTQFMDTSRTFYGPLAVKTGKAPVGFRLSQNYPNPFNPNTEIEYVIDQPSHVSIVVYNLLGKEVKTLVNEEKRAGIYQVKWDGMNEAGTSVPSGIYLYRISAGDKSEIRKMTKMQ